MATVQGTRSMPRSAAPVALLLLLAFGLRVLRLDFQPLWWDEGYSVWFATNPLGQMLSDTASDIHPPLYYLLLHGWIALVGAFPEALRLFSVGIGVLTVAVTYRIGKYLFGARAGLLAAFLLVINPLHIYYSQEVRMYGLVALWMLLASGFAIRLLRDGEGGTRGAWIGYVIATVAALYTQYYAVFLPVGLSLYVLFNARYYRRRLLLWLSAQGVAALAFLPWVLYSEPRLVTYVSQKVAADADRSLPPLTYLLRHLAAFTGGHFEGSVSALWPLALLPLVVLIWRCRPSEPGTIRRERILATTVVTALLLGFIIQIRFPFAPLRLERLLLFILLPFLLWVAARLVRMSPWRTRVGIGLFVLVATISMAAFYTTPRYADDDYRPLIAQVNSMGGSHDVVYAVFPWQVGYFRSYGQVDGPRPVLTPSSDWQPEVQMLLDEALWAEQRIWFPEHLAMGAILEEQVETYLLDHAVPVLNQWFGPNTRLTFWSPMGDVMAEGPAEVPFDHGLILRRSLLSDAPAFAGAGLVWAELDWQLDEPLPKGEYRVRLRLTDDTGITWAQRDSAPVGDRYPFSEWPLGERVSDRHGLWIPAGTPPGLYTLLLSVYRVEDEVALDVLDNVGRPQGVEFPLTKVTVVPPPILPPLSSLPVEHPWRVNMGPLQMVGFSLPLDQAYQVGNLLPLTLFWKAAREPETDYTVRLRLTDSAGAEMARREANFRWPSSQWRAGELVSQPITFLLPPELADEEARLHLSLLRPDDGWISQEVTLAKVQVEGRPHDLQAPQPQVPLDILFGGGARLVGYDLAAEPRPGGTVTLTLYWQAKGKMAVSFSVFVHLLSPDGSFSGQHDSVPGNGAFPTTGWIDGEYLRDEHTFTIDTDAASGEHIVEVGLYEPVGGRRLSVVGASGEVLGDHLLLSQSPLLLAR